MSFANDKHLDALGVGSNRIDQEAFAALANAQNLQGIDVSYTLLDLGIIEALNRLPKLSGLDISGFPAGDTTAQILSNNHNITYLGLNDTWITPYGAQALALVADFSNDNIGDDGAMALSKAPKLLILYVLHNHIGEKGIDALKDANISYYLYEDWFKINSKANLKLIRNHYLKLCDGKNFLACKAFMKKLG